MGTTKLRDVAVYGITKATAIASLKTLGGFVLQTYQSPAQLRGLVGSMLTDSIVRVPTFSVGQDASILAAINREYKLALTASMVTIGPAVALDASDDYNTKVTVTAKPASGYNGDMTFRYRRLLLSRIIQAVDISVAKAISGATKTSDYIALVNSTYGVSFTAADFVDQAVVDNGEYVDITFQAVANHKLITPTPVTWRLRYKPHISTLFSNLYLNGF